MTTMPLRSADQRFDALVKANRRRSLRAQRKALWRAGTREEAVADLCDMLESPPPWATTWKVWEALLAIPGVGKQRGFTMMRTWGVSLVKTLGGLSHRQRSAVMDGLQNWVRGTRGHTLSECPDCGGVKRELSARCRKCDTRHRREMFEERIAERQVCPECGGHKSRYSVRCGPCGRAHLRSPRRTCSCGRRKGKDSIVCWECRYGKPWYGHRKQP